MKLGSQWKGAFNQDIVQTDGSFAALLISFLIASCNSGKYLIKFTEFGTQLGQLYIYTHIKNNLQRKKQFTKNFIFLAIQGIFKFKGGRGNSLGNKK